MHRTLVLPIHFVASIISSGMSQLKLTSTSRRGARLKKNRHPCEREMEEDRMSEIVANESECPNISRPAIPLRSANRGQ